MKYTVGIDKMSFYTTNYVIDMSELARGRDMDVNKCKTGIGQEKMSIISPYEDVITMACEAANDILSEEDIPDIEMVLFATESGFDFSKSSGIYLHKLLHLKPNCRVLEIKQACYAATGALQMACDFVRSNNNKKCLVVSSDIAWYGFKTSGEITQGCGAVAMLVTSNPRICKVSQGHVFVNNVNDFYRPSYSHEPIVNGKLSIKTYLDILNKTMQKQKFSYFCFHMPFATMSDKANKTLGDNQISQEHLEIAKQFGKYVGNIYNGSLYLSLLSVLINEPKDLSKQDIGMFSYGSGSIGEFFSVTISESYKEILQSDVIKHRIERRKEISFEEYESMLSTFVERESSSNFMLESSLTPKYCKFILEKIENGHRYYKKSNEN